jgi:mono/diheme cytochrome c family protein
LSRADASPWRDAGGALTAAAQRGRTVFAAQCVQCHAGKDFTDSDKRVLHDIGTLKALSGQRLGLQLLPGVDTPTLRDAWATAPYLHDGSAPTLDAAVRAHVRIALSDAERADVVEYVRQLGSEETAAPADSSNLVVRALASVAGYVGALFEVRVDGQVIGRGQLDSGSWVDVAFRAASFVAGAAIDIVFLNDGQAGGQDRNLAVGSITLNGTTVLQGGGAGVWLDAGEGSSAFDGRDTFEAASTGGWLPWNGAIRFTAPPAVGGGSDTVVVRAAGTPAGGVWPVMELRINGALVGTRSVGSTTPADLSFAVPPVKPGDRVDVVFTNDGGNATEDRNLYVGSVAVKGAVLTPASAGVVIDLGPGAAAFDGKDTVSANIYGGWIPWDAAMRFTVPAASTDRVVVRAAASLAGGIGAQMEVYLRGGLIGRATVTNTALQDFAFDSPAVQAGDRIDVVFTNDGAVGTEDRNLVVDSVTARGKVLRPGDASAVIDAGSGAAAFDGQDVIPAASFYGWIPWNGAMRLLVP